MALDVYDGRQETSEAALPVFDVQRVQLQFQIASDFVAAQVANNVLILALATGRILRIDLDNPSDIDGNVMGIRDLLSTIADLPFVLRR